MRADRGRREAFADLLLALLLLGSGAAVLRLALIKEDTLAGDPYAVYLPAAEAFRRFDFMTGARHHILGSAWGRAPGFALAIAGVGLVTGLDYLFLDNADDLAGLEPVKDFTVRWFHRSGDHTAALLERRERGPALTVTSTAGEVLDALTDGRPTTRRSFPGASVALDVSGTSTATAELLVLPGAEAEALRWKVGAAVVELPTPHSAIRVPAAARLVLAPERGPLSIAEISGRAR